MSPEWSTTEKPQTAYEPKKPKKPRAQRRKRAQRVPEKSTVACRPQTGTRLAGRVCEGVGEFVWGTRKVGTAKGEGVSAPQVAPLHATRSRYRDRARWPICARGLSNLPTNSSLAHEPGCDLDERWEKKDLSAPSASSALSYTSVSYTHLTLPT